MFFSQIKTHSRERETNFVNNISLFVSCWAEVKPFNCHGFFIICPLEYASKPAPVGLCRAELDVSKKERLRIFVTPGRDSDHKIVGTATGFM
jgi:hypothetical protein